jgi:hypothetical protein
MRILLPLRLTLLAAATLLVTQVATADTEAKRYVIIHSDDAGMSHAVNKATIEGMEKGVVSSASIMVPCPWFPEFAAYAREHREMDFGIHLTLNSEWEHYRWPPVAPRHQVASLVNKEGFLWRNTRQVAGSVKASEVEIELRAQIDRALEFGVPLSHLDTHMGALFTRPDLVEIYVHLGIEYNLPVLFIRTPSPRITKSYPALAERCKELVAALDKHNFPVLDKIFQYYTHGEYDERKQVYLDELRNLKPGVSEIIIHCGYNNDELGAITSSAPLRDSDRRIFTDPEVMTEIEKLGIEVITWKQFHRMTSKQTAADTGDSQKASSNKPE